MTGDELLIVDGQGPPPVVGLRATALAGGRTLVTWSPPAGQPAGEPRFEVSRGEGEKPVEILAPDLAESRYTDVPPHRGRWTYSVIPHDVAGNRGMALTTSVESDDTAPSPPAGLTLDVSESITLRWSATDSDVDHFEIHRTEAPVTKLEDLVSHEPVHRTRSREWVLPPETTGRFHLTLRALDGAGNGSPPSTSLPVDLSRLVPTVTCITDPAGPVRQSVKIRVESDLPITGIPGLTLVPPSGPPVDIPLQAVGERGQDFVGSFAVTQDTVQGAWRFRFTGRSRAGVLGGTIGKGGILEIDTSPPGARVMMDREGPFPPGDVPFTLECTEPMREAPVLSWIPPGKPARKIELEPDPEQPGVIYHGKITIETSLAEGIAGLDFRGTDRAGNEGRFLSPDRFSLETKPPGSPQGLMARGLAGGKVALSWKAPVPPPGSSMKLLAGYRIYRHAKVEDLGKEASFLQEVQKSEWVDPGPPEDGLWHYQVRAMGLSGLESVPGTVASTEADRRGPEPPVALIAREAGGLIELSWEAGSGDPAAYEVVTRLERAGEDPREKIEGPLEATAHRIPIALGGRFEFRVRALDARGNRSGDSRPALLTAERKSPAASLSFDPVPPFSRRPVKVTLAADRPLTGEPRLWFSPRSVGETPGVTATSPTSVTFIPLKAAEGGTWGGSFALDPVPGVVALEFGWEGHSLVDGADRTGELFLEGGRVPVDTAPPRATIRLEQPVPVRDRKLVLQSGEYALTVQVDEALSSEPHLSFRSRSEKVTDIPLMRLSPSGFRGVLAVDSELGDGSGSFLFEGVDPAGNRGDEIAEGADVLVDTTPPSRVGQVRATSMPGGLVRLDWTPPLGPDGNADPEIVAFRIYRSAQPLVDVTGLTPLHTVQRVLALHDRPPGTGTFHYAVQAVDRAGNGGALSRSATATLDLTPPEPPRTVRATILENGAVQLSWEAPPGERPVYYNVYMSQQPIHSRTGLTPNATGISGLETYGTPNEDGRTYFAVTAVDGSLNESEVSVMANLDYHRTLPRAEFHFPHGLAMGDGEYPVILQTTKPLGEPPEVVLTDEEGKKVRLPFTGEASEWRARLAIGAGFREGVWGLSFVGKTIDGITGKEIAVNPIFHVDRTPPLPPANLVVAPDETGTPGTLLLRWNTPKSRVEATDVPYFYKIYRGASRDMRDRALVHTLVVEIENLDVYTYQDVPPRDGEYFYQVVSVDLARNESEPSPIVSASSSTSLPRVRLELFTEGSGDVPTDRVGQGGALLRVTTSRPVAGLAVSWFPWTREEELRNEKAPRSPVSLQAVAETSVTTGSSRWEGRLELGTGRHPEDQEARFAVEVDTAAGKSPVSISSGGTFFIDQRGPEARITIPSIRRMRPDVPTSSLIVVPLKAGLAEVVLETPEALLSPPKLTMHVPGRDPREVELRGFDQYWTGQLFVDPGTENVTASFEYRGVDRSGNVTDVIEPRQYTRVLDETSDPPRTLESHATVGREFTIDTAAPAPPLELVAAPKKLGIVELHWEEAPGEIPAHYELYRSFTPILGLEDLEPVKSPIYSRVIVDDPPVDARYYYAVCAVDHAGNRSPPSGSVSAFVDSIKPELRIRPAMINDDFVLLPEDPLPPGSSIELRFPGQESIEVKMEGPTGELRQIVRPGGGPPVAGIVLPEVLELFNGTVEIVVHSPDPEGNMVETITEIAAKPISSEMGGRVEATDGQVVLEVPPGVTPVIPKGPGEVQRVGGYEHLFFIRYENVPQTEEEVKRKEDPREPDPIPPGLEVVGRPYRVEINQDTQEPMQLKGSVSQADFSQLQPLMAKLRMKIPITLHSQAASDPDYLKTRLKVIQWVPRTRAELEGKTDSKRGRWKIVPDVELDPGTRELVVPANEVTTYVVVAERTPPRIADPFPEPGSTIHDFRPVIQVRAIDKGTGVATGAENPVRLLVDGFPIEVGTLEISEEDPTEVTIRHPVGADLKPGVHFVTLRIQDVVENESVLTWSFTVDNEPPRLVEMQPLAGTRVETTRPLVTARVEDESVVDDPSAWSATIDGAPLETRFDPVSRRMVAISVGAVPEGAHDLAVSYRDRGGKVAHHRARFTTAGLPPAPVPILPSAPGAVLDRAASLVFGLPEGTDLDTTSVALDLDGALTTGTGVRWESAQGRLTLTLPGDLPRGDHRARLLVASAAGSSGILDLPFSIDPDPPALVPAPEAAPAREGWLATRVEEPDSGIQVESGSPHLFDPGSGLLYIAKKGTNETEVTLRDRAGHDTRWVVDLDSGRIRGAGEAPGKIPEVTEVPPGASPFPWGLLILFLIVILIIGGVVRWRS